MIEKIENIIAKLKKISSFLTMKRIAGIVILFLIIAGLIVTILLDGKNIATLNPKGVIADQQLDLIVFTTLLGMVVVIPVFILLFMMAFKYREGNKKAVYQPDQEGSSLLEFFWWGIPILIILVLSVVTWISTHNLDPHRKLESDKQTLKVQVVALQWKWLFIYPDREVASVNELRLPVDTPVEFNITADAPMSAFWIPNLGTQVYAMNGMTSKLHLQASETGEYPGYNTNINGEGYAKMRFKAVVTSEKEFDMWTKAAHSSDRHLDWSMYNTLAKQSTDNPVTYYMLHDTSVYDQLIAKYMEHGGHGVGETKKDETMNHEGMHH